MGIDFVSGQYGCLFSRCRKHVINSLLHGHFHIGLAIIPRPILAFDSVSGQYEDLGMITRQIWKCPCINLYILQYIISAGPLLASLRMRCTSFKGINCFIIWHILYVSFTLWSRHFLWFSLVECYIHLAWRHTRWI
jgi:hypothetical protein